MTPIRVLVIEDFEPFRRFICSTLAKRANLQIICEVSDGQQGIDKAEELKPDLILLDIGLPTRNGISVARQLRILTPGSKVVFVTQECSADIVQAAFSTGALGYVVKTAASGDLLAAIDAVLEGRQFASACLRVPVR